MKKSAVYTRTGDTGLTSLVGGSRIKKSDERIHLYGEVDELNSHIGVGVSLLKDKTKYPLLEKIQSALFDLGSNLACETENREQYKLPQITDELINEIEKNIDKLDHEVEPLKNFILPGGDVAASQFHVCRTVTRRIERSCIGYNDQNPNFIPENALKFLNRLSDYFFVLSRHINHDLKVKEVIWKSH